MPASIISAEVIEGTTYSSATVRGVSSSAYYSAAAGQWWVSSRRLSLGRWNAGGGKWYASLADLAAGCKAFAGLDALISAPALEA
jgi:hypothetical protein